MLGRSRSMLRRTSLGAAVVLGLALSVGQAAAYDSSKGQVQITAYAGGYFGGQLYTGYSTTSGNIDVGSAFDYGGQLAYVFNHVIGLEFTYGHDKAPLSLTGSYLQPDNQFGDLTENRYEFDINFYTNPNKVVGYFALGAGWTDYSATVDNLDPTNPNDTAKGSSSKFVTNIGLGALIYVKPNVAIRLDGRWRYTDTNYGSNYVYCDIYGYCYTYDDSYYGSGTVTGGITFIPGKK
jgi:hypothetical protein